MADVLPLAGDDDAYYLICEVERAFAICFAPADLEACRTAGDLHQLVLGSVLHADRTNTTCLAAKAFFRLRRAIESEQPDRVVRPATPLAELAGRIDVSLWLSRLQRRTGLRLPTQEVTAIGCAVILATIAGLAASVVVYGWAGLLVSLPLSVGLGAASLRWLTRLPQQLGTMGDLARAVAALNPAALVGPERSIRTLEVWTALQGIIQDNLSPDTPVERTTPLFRARG
jgi:hypothetical protein